jgi:DNA primase
MGIVGIHTWNSTARDVEHPNRIVWDLLVRTDPALYTNAFPKQGRERQILLDYLRNNRTIPGPPFTRPGQVCQLDSA